MLTKWVFSIFKVFVTIPICANQVSKLDFSHLCRVSVHIYISINESINTSHIKVQYVHHMHTPTEYIFSKVPLHPYSLIAFMYFCTTEAMMMITYIESVEREEERSKRYGRKG